LRRFDGRADAALLRLPPAGQDQRRGAARRPGRSDPRAGGDLPPLPLGRVPALRRLAVGVHWLRYGATAAEGGSTTEPLRSMPVSHRSRVRIDKTLCFKRFPFVIPTRERLGTADAQRKQGPAFNTDS